MKKNIFGRKLKRDKNERKALFKSLMSALIIYDKIETTEQKAKSVKGLIEKLVTKARKNEPQSRNAIASFLTPEATERLITTVAPRFATRPGGYTRLVRLGRRFNDNADMVIMEWVESASTSAPLQIAEPKEKKSRKDDVVESTVDTKVEKKKAVKKETTKKAVKVSRKKETK